MKKILVPADILAKNLFFNENFEFLDLILAFFRKKISFTVKNLLNKMFLTVGHEVS